MLFFDIHVILSTGQLLEIRNDPLTSQHILRIKDDVGTCWHDVGAELGIGEGILQNTDRDYRTSREKAHNVLTTWTQQKGTKLRWDVLLMSLLELDIDGLQTNCSVCKWSFFGE